jgi:hypothetical protein
VFVEDGQIVEHLPRGTGIDHNCLRVKFVTNMVRGHNGWSGAVELVVLRWRICMVKLITVVISDGKCCPDVAPIVVAIIWESDTMLVTSLTATSMEVSFVARTSLARTSWARTSVTLTMVIVMVSLATISVMSSTAPSITTHGMTALVTLTINVVRAAMTNLAACVTGAGKSIVGNHGALRALWPIVADAL